MLDFRRVWIVERDSDIERFVAELRKRMRLVEGQRSEHRINLLLKIGSNPRQFGSR